MRALALVLLLAPAVAAAHPIEPVLAGSPSPTPDGMFTVDAAASDVGGEKGANVSVSAGIGGSAELFVGGSYDANEKLIGPATVGAKILFLMEDATSLDLAMAVSVSSDRSASGLVYVGRTVVPGLYLQGALGVAGSTPPPAMTLLRAPRHAGIGAPETGGTVGIGSAALQWAPIPRLIPTFELLATTDKQVWIVPEVIGLASINHFAAKLAVPIRITTDVTTSTDVGVILAVAWQG